MNKLSTKLLLSFTFLTIYGIQAQDVIFSDSFENYTDFAIANVGNWTLRDGDGSSDIHVILEADFPNNNQTARSFIVFNPLTITQPNPGLGYNAQAFQAQDRQKYMVNIANYGSSDNNDWLISPRIPLGASNNRITFWAKSLRAVGPALNSSIRVAISTTNTNISSFAFINNNNAIQIADPEDIEGGSWSQYSIDIPANYNNQPVHIAINVISNSYFLMFDNFTVTTNNVLEINDIALNDSSVLIFPNPSSNYITVKNKNNKTDSFDFSIIDITGKVIKKGESKFNEVLNIENIARGNYFINIKTKEGLILKKKLLKK